MNRQSGALRIFLYNWPVYVGTWGSAAVVLAALPFVTIPLPWLVAVGAITAVVWSVASLVISLYIYDRSELASGRWVPRVLGLDLGSDADPAGGAWATIHAGLDAELDLDAVLHGPCVARLDIFDPTCMTAPSIARARARTPMAKRASPCTPTTLALDDASCDAIVVAFTAHEIRDPRARETFFTELRRALRPGGTVLIVEHLRDVANFLAFGPGYLHFVPRHEWLRLASHAKLDVASETRITPWVMALTLVRPA